MNNNLLIKYNRITNECLSDMCKQYGLTEVETNDENVRRFEDFEKNYIEFTPYQYGDFDVTYYMVKSLNGDRKFEHVKYATSLMYILD